GGFGAVDHLFRGPSSHDADDSGPEISFGIIVAVTVGPLISHSQGLASGHDRDPVDWVGTGHHQAQNGMSPLMVGDPLPVMTAHQQWPFWAEDNFFQRVHKIPLPDGFLALARSH